MGRLKNRKYYKGSYTVEAAAVFSLTFLVLGAFLLVAFYVHDRAVLQCIVCEAASAGSNFAAEEDRRQAADQAMHAAKEQRFMGSRNLSVSAETGKGTVSVRAGANFPVPGLFASFLSGGVREVSCEWNSRITDPAQIIRKIRGAELVLEDLKEAVQ